MRSSFDGSDIGRARRPRAAALRREMQIVFQDPYGSLEPAHDGRRHRRRGRSPSTALGGKERPRAASCRAAPAGRAAARRTSTATRTSSPAASGSASGSRARSSLQPRVHRLRRAGLRARRLDPVADPQPAASTCRTSSASPTSSSRTTSRSSAHLRPRRRDVPRADRRDRRRRRALRTPAAPVHAGAPLRDPGARCPDASEQPDRRCPATCRARSIRRRAAASTRAVRSRSRSAPRSTRCWRATARITTLRATFRARR